MFINIGKAVNWFYYRTLFSLKNMTKCNSDSEINWDELQQTRKKLVDLRFKKVKSNTKIFNQGTSTISTDQAQNILALDLHKLSLNKHKLISDPLILNHINPTNKQDNITWLQEKYASNK